MRKFDWDGSEVSGAPEVAGMVIGARDRWRRGYRVLPCFLPASDQRDVGCRGMTSAWVASSPA